MSGNTSATGGYLPEVARRPPDADTVQKALQQMVAAISTLPGELVRPRWQPMPPVQPDVTVTWASVGVQRVDADEYPYMKHVSDKALQPGMPPGYSIMQRHATLTVVCTIYGPAAEDVAGMLRDGLYVAQNFEPVRSLGLKLRTVHDLARNPELVNQQYINRVDLSLEFRMQLDRVYPIFDLDGADVTITDGRLTAKASVRGAAPIPPATRGRSGSSAR